MWALRAVGCFVSVSHRTAKTLWVMFDSASNRPVNQSRSHLITVRYFTTTLLVSHLDEVIIRAFISSCFDSRSSLYFSITQTFFFFLSCLHLDQNADARLLTRSQRAGHRTPLLSSPHSLAPLLCFKIPDVNLQASEWFWVWLQFKFLVPIIHVETWNALTVRLSSVPIQQDNVPLKMFYFSPL